MEFFRTDIMLIILAAGVATYLTRIGGYLVLARFKNIPPRVEAALDAVPAAVLTSIVAPAAMTGGWEVTIVLLAAFALGFKLSGLRLLVFGWALAMVLRHMPF